MPLTREGSQNKLSPTLSHNTVTTTPSLQEWPLGGLSSWENPHPDDAAGRK